MGEAEKPQADQISTGSKKPLWLDILDVSAKVAGAIFLLVVAWIGNRFQSRLTGISLQSQREQAESQLRAQMFGNLISPIVGPTKDGKDLDPDREELLTELLALNFHENFELKPLMQDVDRKLAEKQAKGSSPSGSAPLGDQRRQLWSIARRVAARQIASIQWQWASSESNRYWEWVKGLFGESGGCRVYTITFFERLPDTGEKGGNCTPDSQFNDVVSIESPDGANGLQLVAHDPNWGNETVHVEAEVHAQQSHGKPGPAATYSFILGWFDLPLTDNTLLPDGNRFAVNLQAVNRAPQDLSANMVVRIIWFPKGYFTARERPFDFLQVRKLMGLPKQ